MMEKEKAAAEAIARDRVRLKTIEESKKEIEKRAKKLEDSRSAMIYMLKDLTRAHYDLEEAMAYTENIIESMADTLIVVNLNGRMGRVNKATLDLLKYKEKELIGKPFGEIMVSAKGDKTANKMFTEAGLRELISIGRVKDLEVTYVSKSGKNISMSLSSALMKDSKVELQGIVCVAKDLSGRRKTEKKLRLAHESLSKKARELEEANEGLSQYAYVSAHDLRTPMGAIHNYADFLREDLEGTSISKADFPYVPAASYQQGV